MSHWIITNEAWIRISFFAGVLVAMAVWEQLAPRRRYTAARGGRWVNNLGISLINTAAVRLLLPATAVAMALLAEDAGWGLLNRYAVPHWFALIAGVVMLDFTIYLQHVMFHAVPALWRLHRVHHADLDFDVTTGIRFHPIEILLSMLIKYAAIVALGAPATAVLIFEVLLNATSMFNHGNVRLPRAIDRWLRLVVVTPEMHRVHHSVAPHETNSNFGFNLPWWDRLFGTYQDQPDAGHEGMTIGIEGWHDENLLERLPGMLMLPFRYPSGDRYPINRRWR
jgi:sterol desaturase/sphingolipid hydroxylase (fatty acid hydroxylase superfamily)